MIFDALVGALIGGLIWFIIWHRKNAEQKKQDKSHETVMKNGDRDPAMTLIRACKVLSIVLIVWTAVAIASIYDVWIPFFIGLFNGESFTGESAEALLDLLTYIFGLIAGILGISAGKLNNKEMSVKSARFLMGALASFAGLLCLPATGMVHLTYCTDCTSIFSRFSAGMWTHFIIMLITIIVFTFASLKIRKQNSI